MGLCEALIESGGELTPDIEQSLVVNKEELEVKGLDYAYIIKEIESGCNVIDAEIERLTKLKGYRHNAIERLKSTLANAMKLHDLEEIKTPLLTINFRKSETVEVDDLDLLDGKYIKTNITQSADKVEIRRAIKEGKTVMGALLKQHSNIQIR